MLGCRSAELGKKNGCEPPTCREECSESHNFHKKPRQKVVVFFFSDGDAWKAAKRDGSAYKPADCPADDAEH